MDLTLQQVLFRLVALLVIAAVHGWALAAAARLLGDPGPQQDGRLTLNPFAHLDFVGGLGLVVFGFGWIKPVALDPAMLRFGRLGLALVAGIGLAAALLLALFLEALRRPMALVASGNLSLYGVEFLEVASILSLAFVLINLVPVPPLTGGYLLRAAVPAGEPILRRYRTSFTVIVAAFIASGLAERVLLPLYQPLARLLLGG